MTFKNINFLFIALKHCLPMYPMNIESMMGDGAAKIRQVIMYCITLILIPHTHTWTEALAEHEMGTKKCLDTCQCKIKFVLTFSKNELGIYPS